MKGGSFADESTIYIYTKKYLLPNYLMLQIIQTIIFNEDIYFLDN